MTKTRKPTDYQAREIETITSGDLSGLSYSRLLALRDFAHWPTPHAPNLLAVWYERGERFFQAAQSERRAEMGY